MSGADTGGRTPGWAFWVDRGGTFTDVVALRPDGRLLTDKLLSDSDRYEDAAVEAMRRLMEANPGFAHRIDAVRMGTTVATNALLERRGEPVVLIVTAGFADALAIGHQQRPDLFARHIVRPRPLYDEVIEANERVGTDGSVLQPLDEDALAAALAAAHGRGYRAAAIVFMHGYRYVAHERRAMELALAAGFTQVSTSHRVSPLMKLIGRGDTTTVDAYLSPVLHRYIRRVSDGVRALAPTDTLLFMQSHGGMAEAEHFHGKDSILSGPAGGVVGMARTAERAGHDRVVGFDMGGTSTDVSVYHGRFERTLDATVAGVRVRAPMLQIHTVAAGGGSLLRFAQQRLQVGPESAGASPGPVCYGRGGPLAVTDANVLLGRLQPSLFPRLFGADGRQPLDDTAVREAFVRRSGEVAEAGGQSLSAEALAAGYLRIAVQNMANAIKQITTQRGLDVTRYAMACFGGAGGQHACQVADELGVDTVLLHPLAGVLSAYGMGLAELSTTRERTAEQPLEEQACAALDAALDALAGECLDSLSEQGVERAGVRVTRRLLVRLAGSDTALAVEVNQPLSADAAADAFHREHERRYGFEERGHELIVETVQAEAAGGGRAQPATGPREAGTVAAPLAHHRVYFDGRWRETPFHARDALSPGARISGPAVIVEDHSTTVLEPGWSAGVVEDGTLVLSRARPRAAAAVSETGADPVLLEVFNNRYRHIAEQMGTVLENTAHSVNIKERLDFSCAVFDGDGELIANAPHMPIHLGSMGESVQAVMRANRGRLARGQVYMLNDPYNGGTHLPDVTVVTPVFGESDERPLFWVASRAHHADIGGVTPGSMPPHSTHIDEEGVLFDNFLLVADGRFREQALRQRLTGGRWPARNPNQNVADLKAQIAANARGIRELEAMVHEFGLDAVRAYMGHVKRNAEAAVREVIDRLDDGHFELTMDGGECIRVRVTVDRRSRSATVDFTGTSAQGNRNFNAPAAITRAAVLYVFRTLVEADIPLNAGCLAPLRILNPAGSLLNPVHPAAVVAGNVETSQCITDALYGALGALAGSQGTMNNLTFGDAHHQYYETLCGGAGAGPGFAGADAVHTHMTNSRLTDPEVLEYRYPVRLRRFAIRRGSGGRGRWRGGDGVLREIGFLAPMDAAILSNNRQRRPFGMAGGEDAATGRNTLLRADGAAQVLDACAAVSLQPGDALRIETPGGGGWGEPGAGTGADTEPA